MKAKAVDSVTRSQLCLFLQHTWIAQVVVSKHRGNMRLIVAVKIRTSCAHIGPLSKSFSPPFIIFRDRVKLREIKRDCFQFSCGWPSHGSRFMGNLKTGAIGLEGQILSRGNSSFGAALKEEMSQRFHPCFGDVWVCAKIKLRVKFRIRLKSLFPTDC